MARLLLIRHGQTEWNTQGRVQGGGGLTTKGRRDVEALVLRLQKEKIAAIYCSPTLRTMETAQALAQALGLEVRIRQELADLDYGKYSGDTLQEAQAADPDLFRRWQDAPHTVQFPGGEGLTDLRRRVMGVVQEMTDQHPEEMVALVTHDSPIRVVVCSVLGLDDSHHMRLQTEPGSLTVVEVSKENAVLIALNDRCHMQGSHAAD